ncbi:FAD-dependent monooxygenase [Pseudoroseicyclus aestuarii]|uniref:2-octaprenyl-6-methoxyphenol hydroxylase n=1 Tax=Pseudoroseicyclus aestuarii TaxID=1795041 RepID=A0A318TBM9_9RHOB|nr:FAD-dependent monooxygenase [Pseudoroseicyclus aestuarii]PYE85748.1 2-octaprenyl-6-methoxyphenol hydroxylase [Pseudoroseicyclus aestuarii]
MSIRSTDILVAGGGPAGLSAAAAFAAAGFDTLCVDPAPVVTDAAAPGADLRTTAVLQPGQALLDEAGVWDALAPLAAPLEVMRIVDAGRQPPLRRDFASRDFSEAPFGWNLPNTALRRALAECLSTLPQAELRQGTGFAGLTQRDETAMVQLTDGSTVAARLVIAADGRDSPVRAACGIGARSLRYGQSALVFAVTHEARHEMISTEVHRSGGPFTLVPLPDLDGRPCSSVVWMERTGEARRLAALPDEAFSAEATERSAGVLGPLTLASRRQLWPILTRVADRITAPRVALAAEAAHVIPPIGAQGLNMSLADIACLLRLAQERPEGLGDAVMLSAYSRARLPDIRLRVAGIDALNRASIAGAAPLRALRSRGLGLLHDAAPIRHAAMRLGLGAMG